MTVCLFVCLNRWFSQYILLLDWNSEVPEVLSPPIRRLGLPFYIERELKKTFKLETQTIVHRKRSTMV